MSDTNVKQLMLTKSNVVARGQRGGKQNAIDKWNAVMKALAALYESYNTEAIRENMLQDLEDLMQAYDEWLD